MGHIPIDPGDCELDERGKPKVTAATARSFNLLRLREIANQRDMTLKTFDGEAADDNKVKNNNNNNNRVERKKSSYASSLASESSTHSHCLQSKHQYIIKKSVEHEDDSNGEDGDVSDLEDFVMTSGGGHRVTFEDNEEKQLRRRRRHLRRLRGDFANLEIVPTASMSKPESPFVSPSKKRAQRVLRASSSSPELNEERFNKEAHYTHPPFETKELRQHRMTKKNRASSSSPPPPASPGVPFRVSGFGRQQSAHFDQQQIRNSVKKIGGGAVVSSSTISVPRPQMAGVIGSIAHAEVGVKKVAIVDFNALVEQNSPKKKSKMRRKF